MTKKIDILNTFFDNVTENEAVSLSKDALTNRQKHFIVTANPEIVMYAQANPDYKDIVNQADLVVADGIGVVIGSKILKRPLEERVAGFDLMKRLLKEAAQNDWNVFLLGAKESTVTKASDRIKETYPSINIVGTHDGYFDLEDRTVLDKVINSKADMVFVAMGYPRQEEWIRHYFKQVDYGLAMGVGGSFDVWADEVKRAPLWIQKINLEWFYRLVSDPKRIGRMRVLPEFLIEVLKEKWKEAE